MIFTITMLLCNFITPFCCAIMNVICACSRSSHGCGLWMRDWEADFRIPPPQFFPFFPLRYMGSTRGIVDWNSTFEASRNRDARNKRWKLREEKPYEQELVIARKLTRGRRKGNRQTDWLWMTGGRRKANEECACRWCCTQNILLKKEEIAMKRKGHGKNWRWNRLSWEFAREGIRMGLDNWNDP